VHAGMRRNGLRLSGLWRKERGWRETLEAHWLGVPCQVVTYQRSITLVNRGLPCLCCVMC
jgi:hypothetical protein